MLLLDCVDIKWVEKESKKRKEKKMVKDCREEKMHACFSDGEHIHEYIYRALKATTKLNISELERKYHRKQHENATKRQQQQQ